MFLTPLTQPPVCRRVKTRIHDLFQQDRDFTADDIHQLNPTGSISVAKALSRLSQLLHMLLEFAGNT